LATVGTGVNGPNMTANTSSRTTLPPGGLSPLVSNSHQLAATAVDAVFAEPSLADAIIAKQGPASMSSLLPDQPARVFTSDGGWTRVTRLATAAPQAEVLGRDIVVLLSGR